MEKLTRRQEEILDYIKSKIRYKLYTDTVK